MYRVNSVALWISRSEEIIRAASFIATLFPAAVYHLIAVIPRIRSRTFLTSLYSHVLNSIASEAIESVELELLRRGVQVVKKSVIYGDPLESVVRYVEKANVDLVVAATAIRLSEDEIVENPVANLVNVVHKPVLIYVAMAKTTEMPSSIAIISKHRIPITALSLAFELAHRGGIDITLFLTGKPPLRELETFVVHSRALGARVFIEILRESATELAQDIAELTKEHDMVIVDRALFEERRPLPPKRRFLSDLERMVIAVSHCPILFV